jgi:signal transduction histidine kinase
MKLATIILLFLPGFLPGQLLHEGAYIRPDSVLELLSEMDDDAMNLDQVMAKGVALLKLSQYDSSLAILVSIENRFPDRTDADKIEVSYLLARCYYFKGDYSPAILNILEGVALAEQIVSDKDIVLTKRFAGELYRASDNPDLAQRYLNEALTLGYEINDRLGIAYSLNRLGVVAYQNQNHEKADSLFQLSMPIAIALNDMNVISMNLNDMGEVYNNQRDFQRSLALYQQALELPLGLDMRINTQINVARTYVSMGKYNDGIASAQEALDAANEAEILTLAVDAARAIADGYMFQGMHEQGIKYYRKYMNYRGKLFEEKKNAEILELETRYETEKNKLLVEAKDIEIKQQESRIRLFVLGSLLLACLLLVIAYFFIRSRKLQRDLAALNQTKDKLFAIVSHDLRNALTSFEGIGGIICKYVERKEYEKVGRVVQEFDKESRQVYQLLDNLLNWSITQLKDVPFQPVSLSLKSHVEKSCQLFEGIANQKGVRIDVDLESELAVKADPNALSLIFRNFISNAIKYTPSGGLITISANRKNDKVEILISDNGIGFSKKQLTEIQSANGMISKVGTDGEQGTGLGLTLCLEYLDMHNSILSTEPNIPTGTIFKFELALAA